MIINAVGLVLGTQSLRAYAAMEIQSIERIFDVWMVHARNGRVKVFKFIQSTPVGGDCTCGYEIKLDREYTVKDFIDIVLTERADEWGYIGVYNPSDFCGRHFGNPKMEYRYGKIIAGNFTEDILNKEIKSVSASGGWSRMDYVFKCKLGGDPDDK